MFRSMILEGLSVSVKSKLDDVVCIIYKPEAEFHEYVVHAIERHGKAE